ncbi:Holliday junction branch migration protein RuvA [Phycisphaerales bacterium AB-hyl4]|uniref:Holliday junction branch migration complex subunit RuvA n=1 Tax=Natronomicrosphaera hydrolytica TaxID=3242702 RepID=A0ABV4U668_9BACT
MARMIARIEGILESIDEDRAQVAMPAGFTLDVLLPAFAAVRLAPSSGSPITLHTVLFIEAQAQGTTMLPRLVGFLTPEDRAFYQLFITTKGIGQRKALRAMTLPVGQIAAAIADRDTALLQSLPEIGKRTAETIAVSLSGKVDRFIQPTATGDGGPTAAVGLPRGSSIAREALEVLLQLGENRAEAVAWIDQVLGRDDAPTEADQLIAEVYRLKAGT